MRLLINNVEQTQPDERNDTLIKLYGRAPEDPSERKIVTVYGFDPYFYVREAEARDKEDYLLEQDCITGIEYGDFDGFKGDDLAKISVPYPQDTRDARELFEDHWSADVPFTRRFLIDTEIRAYVEVPDEAFDGNEASIDYRQISPVDPGSGDENPTPKGVETGLQDLSPRVFTLDIEVDDRGEGFPELGEERILSIVAHDNYSDEVRGFVDLEGRDIEDAFPDGAPDGLDALDVRPNERQMLISFRSWFQQKDPDLVTGWNADDFDIPFIIKRMDNLTGVNPNVLSPGGWSGFTNRGEPRIKGRTVYDLLEVYKKNSFTELRSYTLDNVAKEELGAEKIHFDGSFHELYTNDPEKFIEYNARDVLLSKDINEEANVIGFRDTLRREVGVSFEDSYDNKDFVDMMCRRRLSEKDLIGPSRPAYGEEPDSDYEGAHVMSPYEGVAKNVVGIDLASLYPYTMAMTNASPETKVERVVGETEPEFVAQDGTVLSAEDVCQASNGQYFRTDVDGLFKELVDWAISLKSEYKRKRENADSDEEYEFWEEKYNVAKTLTNSLYGVTGWERFFLYDERVAEAVTLTGQTVIKRTAEYVEAEGHEVLYGDTDSTYIKFSDDWDRDACLSVAFRLCDELNETVYPELAESIGLSEEENLWEIETEVYMKRFFQAGKKKRYAYLPTWKDGREIDEPKPSISGFSSKRSDSSKLTENTEKAIFDAILSGESDRVSTIVFEAAKKIKPSPEGEEWELLGIPGGMNKKITDDPQKAESDAYYAVSVDGEHTYPQGAHPRATYNANKILKLGLSSDAKPMRVYLKPTYFDSVERKIDVVAFEEGRDLEEIENQLMINVSRMTDTLLREPLREILEAVDVDVNAAVRGHTQTGLGAFS